MKGDKFVMEELISKICKYLEHDLKTSDFDDGFVMSHLAREVFLYAQALLNMPI